MCTGLEIAIISTAVSAAGSATNAMMASEAADAEAGYRNYQLQKQNEQLKEDMKLTEVQALETENARREQARRVRAQNDAFLAGSGVGESRSFLDGVDQTNDRALRADLTSLRTNASVATSRIADQIGVNNAEAQFARTRASMIKTQAWTDAGFSTASAGLENFRKIGTYKKPRD